jgi:hypothetical protein
MRSGLHLPCPLAPVLLLALLTMAGFSCRTAALSPESLAQNLASAIRDADPQGSGIFFIGKESPSADQLVVTYRISRKDDQDDVWARKRMLNFLFRPAPDDPGSVGGWYLERIQGDYLDYVGVAEGLQFDWDYCSYSTKFGSGHGIIGLAGTKNVQ